ncbi:MAG: recombinase family protein [Vulcanimicrobiaceae bacterium]
MDPAARDPSTVEDEPAPERFSARVGPSRTRGGADRDLANIPRPRRPQCSVPTFASSLQTRRLATVALRSLTDHIDTRTAAGRMLYAVLGAVAQFERDVLRGRTVAGLAAAKRRGERLGRRPALSPAQVAEAKKMLKRGESPNHVARVLRVGRSTLYRAIIRISRSI